MKVVNNDSEKYSAYSMFNDVGIEQQSLQQQDYRAQAIALILILLLISLALVTPFVVIATLINIAH